VKLATLRALLADAPAMLRTYRPVLEVQRLAFLGAAGRAGLLARLGSGPATLDELAAVAGTPAEARDALAAWLAAGVRLGELGRDGEHYWLRGRLARTLADPERDAALALVESAIAHHARVLFETPSLLASGRRLALADLDGERIARVSKLSEPLLREAIDEVVPARGAMRLLEVGCGDATHLRHALLRNPDLTAVAVEIDAAVAARALANLAAWGLGERAQVVARDVRALEAGPPFDLVTLHQNVYYFPLAERTPLFAALRGLSRAGSRLLITSTCRGGSMVSAVLDVWGRITEGAGPLPEPEELARQLEAAGWREVSARNLLPGDRFYRFIARA
jgi:protein-L-isoaspartate O-methyltransferase